MRAHISDVPIIPSKLLQISDRSLVSRSSFEGIIGTDIHACFMASLLVMLEVGASLFFLPRFYKGKEEEIGMATAGYEDTIKNIPSYITASAQLLLYYIINWINIPDTNL